MLNAINNTNLLVTTALAAKQTHQDIATAVTQKSLAMDKANGEAVLKLIGSAASTGRIDVFV